MKTQNELNEIVSNVQDILRYDEMFYDSALNDLIDMNNKLTALLDAIRDQNEDYANDNRH